VCDLWTFYMAAFYAADVLVIITLYVGVKCQPAECTLLFIFILLDVVGQINKHK